MLALQPVSSMQASSSSRRCIMHASGGGCTTTVSANSSSCARRLLRNIAARRSSCRLMPSRRSSRCQALADAADQQHQQLDRQAAAADAAGQLAQQPASGAAPVDSLLHHQQPLSTTTADVSYGSSTSSSTSTTTSSSSSRAALWSAVMTLLQQGLVLAAASSLVLSMCLSAPAASAHSMILQQQQFTSHASTAAVRMVVLQPHASTSAAVAPGGALLFSKQSQLQPQPQQQQHAATWHFELHDSSSSSSSSSSSDDSTSISHLQQPQHHHHQDQQQQQPPAWQFELGSQMEDSLLEGMRQFEAGVDRAFGALSNSMHYMDAAQASSEQAAMDAQAQALIREVWEVVDTNYLDARRSGFDHEKWARLRDEALARSYYDTRSMHRAVRDMLAQGVSDPYCRFIEPGEFAAMKKYDVTGVGLNLGTAEEYVKKTGRALPRAVPTGDGSDGGAGGGVWVVGLSKESEADRAGIQQGDQLLQVSGLSLSGVTPFQAATLIAGPDDSASSTPVGLVVKKADGEVVNVTVQRPARYLPTPVTSSLQQRYSGQRVGVIRLTSFNARALRDVSQALEQLQQQGATELVLDLRDNRGGLVSEGLEVARLFLSDSVPIVLTQSKAMAADPPRALTTAATRLPLTVLVNEHTASASEILAGAIKDNCRGVLVGKRTYGKGLIQSVYELSDSSGLIITVGKYLTPRGVDIDRFGIAPDFGSLPEPTAAEDTLNACKLEATAASAGAGAASQQQPQPQLVSQQLANATGSSAAAAAN